MLERLHRVVGRSDQVLYLLPDPDPAGPRFRDCWFSPESLAVYPRAQYSFADGRFLI